MPAVAAGAASGSAADGGDGGDGVGDRKPQGGDRPLPLPAVERQRAAELGGEAVDHRQAEPGAPADALGREEGLDRPGEGRLVHADAGVGDGRAGRSGRERGRRTSPAATVSADRGDGEDAAARHRVAGVHGEVEDRHLELVGVGPGIRAAASSIRVSIRICGPGGARDQLDHPAHQLGQVDRPRLERLAAGEGEQALDQGPGALGRLQRPFDQPLLARRRPAPCGGAGRGCRGSG